jgi:outer membrane receptor protein involved in Fe transport
VLDITTKSEFTPGGSANLYGGSFNTLSPSVEYGGSGGNTQYFVAARYLRSDEGLENATSAADPIHDKTEQGKSFGYVSTLLDDSNRLTFMTGTSVSQLQIPDMPGQTPLGDFGPANDDSTTLNENERDAFAFGILALQTQGDDFDTQLSVFSRYADIHFVPDVFGDLVFNDVASDVSRKSLLDGVQFDGSKSISGAHTLRAGFGVAAEQTSIDNTSTVLPTDGNGDVVPGAPITITDAGSKLGWNLGVYLQDEWKLTDALTLNTGLRFDQLYQYVDANQVSPRVALVDKPFEGTTLHAGYARYFTPPMQSEAASSNIAAFNNTTQQAAVPLADAVRPERAHYFDVGIDQTIRPGLTAGADAFYKIATDQLDDGQFGSAVVLTQFNLAKGYSEGIVANVKYQGGGWAAYANFAAVQVMVVDVVSNQYLIGDPEESAYDAAHYHHSDDDQTFTASYGASYRWGKTLASADSTFGSGLRSGFANIGHTTPYDVVNAALSRDFSFLSKDKPLTARIEAVNLFDSTYLLRSGSGIGEFAPEYGPRRGIYGSLSQRF